MKNFIILFVLLSANLTAQPFTDIDKDNDGLIEVSDIETLNAMRYRLDGSGLQLSTATAVITTGCAVGGCKGYELTQDLDFNDVASYQNLANMKLWTTDAGWQPIGTAEQPFTAIFKTNNSSIPNTIFNLKISRADESNVGLFGHIGNTAEISGIGLLDATVEGNHQVGSLVGKNAGGQISNSYANGHVVGKGGAIGLLVGHSSGSITNSYANGEVSGEANGIGGLVGANHGQIANSYAMGSVVGSANNVGGLVGDNLQGTISNCYTTGSVSGSEDIGGLVGLSNLGTLIGNYVSGKASGKRYIGGLVGSNIGGTITRSYWDKTASNLEGNTGGVGLLAGELQSANAQDEDLKKPYYKWSTAHWDFGTAEQYPILKYAIGSDLNNPVCGPEQTLPNCGALLLGQHASLKHILFLSDVNLIPNFKPTELNYQLGITTGTKTLQFIPIASNPDSSINISRNGIVIDSDLASGTTSSVIILGENTEIVIEVSAANQRPAQYSLTTHYLREITILGIPDKAIDEGESIILDASQNLAAADTLLSYRWTQSSGKTLFPSPDSESAILWLHIPEDYVPATAEHANLGLTLEINNGKATIIKDITLTIAKVDNGNIPVAPPALTILEGTAPEIDLSKDPDGSGKDFSYQWQSRAPGQDTEWIDINEATEKTHIISFLTESYTEYRVLINYTDGQGYKTIAASRAARYVPEIMILDSIKGLASEETIPADAKPQRTPAFVCSTANIDKNKNGLIEICDLEGLNAMRHVKDGSGYKASASAAKITAGCKSGGCKGYELKKDLDFNDDASYSSIANKVIWTEDDGWDPIGYYEGYRNANNRPFTAIFEGNDHTISNLRINRPNTDDVGLFGYIERGTINKVGLLSVKIKGDGYVGGLVGYTEYYGTITNSYATGAVEGNHDVGGLVGINWVDGIITNSYATGDVEGNDRVGGLVGRNRGAITNSYATGDVEGNDRVGGLVGENPYNGKITNSYATGAVEGNDRVGGLVGRNNGKITNSYATDAVTGTRSYVGGLVGYNYNGTITNSYATDAVTGTGSYVGGLVGYNYNGTITNSGVKTTAELQRPTSAIGIYAHWSTANWDFGTSNQYPALKYRDGTLLPGQYPSFLAELDLSDGLDDITLFPNFHPQRFHYNVKVGATIDAIELTATTNDTNAYISIGSNIKESIINNSQRTVENVSVGLTIAGDTIITIEVTEGEQRPTPYTITVLKVDEFVCSTANIDQDDDGLIEICDLEGLNAIRYQLDGSGYNTSHSTRTKITAGCPEDGCKGYELRKNLDFNDDASYSSIANKVIWTEDDGWDPIGYYHSSTNNKAFTAIFEGNDHTISNLMIDRSNTDAVGLFGHAAGITINNVGLLSVKIKGDRYVGGLVGTLSTLNDRGSSITNSYATGAVTGNNVGGLVGRLNGGTIRNSYATGAVTGTGSYVGGLVGENSFGTITNSYATGDVTGTGDDVGGLVGNDSGGTIKNSYATGSVRGSSRVGGLVGTLTLNGRGSSIMNSYATGDVTGTRNNAGSLVGYSDRGAITYSYATGDVTGTGRYVGGLVGRHQNSVISNSGDKTTADLQEPTSAIGIYAQWSTVHWDFGTDEQYPALKYAAGYDTDNPACDLDGQPVCGTLLPGQYPSFLAELDLSDGSDDITLSPNFHPERFRYNVKVGATIDAIELTATTSDTNAYISIGSNIAGSITNNNQRTVENISVGLTIAGDTIITIEVTEGEQRPTPYTITVNHNISGNLAPPGIEVGAESVDEGQQVTVNLEYSGNCNLVNVKCRLEFPGYPSLSSDVLDKRELQITIPDDFVEANRSTQNFVVIFAIRQGGDIASKETTLVVRKANNGSISNKPTLVGSQLIAPDLSGDPDKGVQESSVRRYQWQKREAGGWVDIGGATASTYTPEDMSGGEEYRVQISYTDGQGYGNEVESNSINYVDIDRDNDGLIEIETREELYAIRHQLDGSGYKANASTPTITAGCPMNDEQQRQCRGYELKAHIDLSGGRDWEPIGNANNPFNAIFEGNHYTISNLKISSSSSNVGFFGRTTRAAKIRNVGLLNVNITADGRNKVGGLVGFNKGTIEGSYVVSSGIRGGSHVGALVGGTSGGVIKNNYATVKSLSQNNSSVCKLIGEINGGMIEGNKMIGPCENNKLFECPAP